jgi:hypothetical protein
MTAKRPKKPKPREVINPKKISQSEFDQIVKNILEAPPEPKKKNKLPHKLGNRV